MWMLLWLCKLLDAIVITMNPFTLAPAFLFVIAISCLLLLHSLVVGARGLGCAPREAP